MIKKIIKICISLFLTISTFYYVIAKFLLKQNNQFTSLIDGLIMIIGKVLSFIANHIFAVLIVIGSAVILWVLYKVITSKNSGDKE